jgi:hypothetical protein
MFSCLQHFKSISVTFISHVHHLMSFHTLVFHLTISSEEIAIAMVKEVKTYKWRREELAMVMTRSRVGERQVEKDTCLVKSTSEMNCEVIEYQ